MNDIIRLTRDIHKFVRGQLNWEESLQLLHEIAESDEWMSHLEIDMMIYQMATEKVESERLKIDRSALSK